jgi:predicted GTPase
MDSAIAFQERKQDVMRLFESATSLAHDIARKDAEDRLREAEDRFAKEQLYVVVCGEFKQGKSSFINALLEEPGLCPVDILVTTSLVSTISYASEEKITVYLGEPGNAQPKEIDRNEIADYVSEQRNRKNRQNARLLTVEIPNEHLRSGLLLVDTPGVGGVYAEHSSITYGFAPNADVVLFISDALRPLSQTELEFVARVSKHCRNLIFVVTKKDKTPSLQQIVEDDRAKLSQVLKRPADQILITAVSNLLKDRYVRSQNAKDLADSNFPAFERELWGFLNEQRGGMLLMRAMAELADSVADMQAPYQAEWEAYQDHTERELNEIERELTEARDTLTRLLDNKAQWRQHLGSGLTEIRDKILKRSFLLNKEEVERRADEYLQDDKLLQEPSTIGARVAADITLMFASLGKEIIAKATDLQREIETSSKLDLNPFKRDRLLQEIEISPPSPLDKIRGRVQRRHPRTGVALDTSKGIAKNAAVGAGATGAIAANIGAVIGSFTAGIFVPGVGAIPGYTVGFIIGGGIGTVVGAGLGTIRALQQSLGTVRESKYSESKNATEEIIRPFITSYFKTCAIRLDDMLRELESAMTTELEDKIIREEENLSQSIKQFQAARLSSEQEAAVKEQKLRLVLDRFDLLQTQMQATAKTVLGTIELASQPALNEKANHGRFADERNDLT